MQPDVYCRRLNLQVPVAVSVKTGQIADVFHAICSVAMHPYVKELSTDLLAARILQLTFHVLVQEFFDSGRRRPKSVTGGAITHVHCVFGTCGGFIRGAACGVSDIFATWDICRAVGRVDSRWTFAVDLEASERVCV